MNVTRKKIFLVTSAFVLLTAGGGLPAMVLAEKAVVTIGGTGSGLGTMRLLAAAFEKSHPGANIKVISGMGSSGGIKAVLHGAVDIAISGRPLKEDERKDGAIISEYARTPFVFVANGAVKKSGVTIKELEKIYSNQMTNWPDGTRIRLVTRPDAETDTKIVKSLSPAMEQAVKSANSREGMILAVTDQDNADMLEKIPGALGGCTLAQVISENLKLKILGFNGVEPSVNSLRDGSYRLFKVLYLVTTAKSSATARQFVAFVRSTEGRKILAKNGNLVIEAR